MTRWDLGRSPRLRWPLVVLLASIGLIAVAVVDTQRAVRSQQVVATKALHEYATFAVWSYGQHLSERLNALTREALGAVNHGDGMHTNPDLPRARDLAHYLPWDEKCQCHRALSGPNPQTFFAIRIGRSSLDIGVNSHPDPVVGWEVDRPLPVPLPATTPGEYTPNEKQWLVDSLTRRIRGASGPDHGYTLVLGDVDDAVHVVAYTLMPTSWGDTMVYGARYSLAQLGGMLAEVLDDRALLPGTFVEGRRNSDVLVMRVRDRHGHMLFDSAPGVSSPVSVHLDVSPRWGGLSVDGLIRPELAGSLVIGGLPRSHLPFLLGLLALAAAMSVVGVVQLRREGELARLRANFVSSVSHELRTPLAQIRLYVETLRLGRATTPEQRDWSLGHIERETTRLTHLVENTLRYTSLGRGDSTPATPTDVGAEVAAIVAEFQPLADSRRARIETHIGRTPPVPLRADALRHIVLNLLDNAVKYGPTGQTIRVSVEGTDGEVRIVVADEGPGVSDEERERIWSPFLRGAAVQGQGGSGIGLTIVREVAEQHGGRARVESSDGCGARFVVALPSPASPLA